MTTAEEVLSPPIFELTDEEKAILPELVKKVRSQEEPRIIGFPQLFGLLSPDEKKIVDKFLIINPRSYGFNGPFLGMQPVPEDIVRITNQSHKKIDKKTQEIKEVTLPLQYLPKNVYEAYQKLNDAIKKDLGRGLLVDSGYRSPAYQVITFFHYLNYYNFDFAKTASLVAFPGYSEHGHPPKQAIDFINMDGNPTQEDPQDFVNTKEYKWLTENAEKFNFYLSYPEGNPDGITFEPWHWHFNQTK